MLFGGDYMGVVRSKEGGTDQHRAVLRMNEAQVWLIYRARSAAPEHTHG